MQIVNSGRILTIYKCLQHPNFDKSGPIHIIIGVDAYGQIIKFDLIKGDLSSPIDLWSR